MPRPKAVKIEQRTAERLVRNSQYLDKMPRRRAKPDDSPVDFGGGTVLRVTSTIGAGGGQTPGSGMGVIQQFDGTRYTDSTVATPYKIFNVSDKTVAAAAYVLCLSAYGYFHLVNTQCVNVS